MSVGLSLLITLIIIGVAFYVFEALLGDKLQPRVKTAIYALACLLLFLWIMQVLGVWSGGPRLHG